jgi:hypothetical protein
VSQIGAGCDLQRDVVGNEAAGGEIGQVMRYE